MEKQETFHNITFKALFSKIVKGSSFTHIKSRSWRTKIGVLLVFASIISGAITYAALNKTPPFGDDPNLIIWLLNIDLALLLLLASLIARRIVGVWSGRKRGIAGSHLHVRLVYIFSILVAIPTVIMTIFAAVFFHFGVQAWFSQQVQTAINESYEVAQAYLEEHKQVIKADTLAMANDLDRQAGIFSLNSDNLSKALDTQSFIRNLSEAVVINSNGRVLGRSSLAFSLEYETPDNFNFQKAENGDVILMTSPKNDRVRALVKLNNFNDSYLFVGRMVDPSVISHLNSVQQASDDYNILKSQHLDFQITVTMIFFFVGCLLLLAAVWAGLLLARQLVGPIGNLIQASDRVRAGDLSSRIDTENMLEEFEYLGHSFNRMTDQLQGQRNDLLQANKQIDQRRRFIETVLTGVSSGVLGVDDQGLITLANNSALHLLEREEQGITDAYLLDILPELKELLEDFSKRPKKVMQGEVPISLAKNRTRTFLFKISVEPLAEDKNGLIITFDDITDLQSAQRNAAWSDVARRIAHEIKNPLTPIQLSAERIKRKYAKLIEDDKDKEIFNQCTDTIIKHVGDIGKMVDEFSSFGRMPVAELRVGNLPQHIEENLKSLQQTHTNIKFTYKNDVQNTDINVKFDQRQIRQLLINIIQNAVDSIKERENTSEIEGGVITIIIGMQNKHNLYISINDNGIGFPTGQDADKLTEPYITHKKKGTGLGLAIVKKIMEDHRGEIILGAPKWLTVSDIWHDNGGANVTLIFPLHIEQ